MNFSTIEDELLFRRLDEIDGQLQDWHISAYKSDLLITEQEAIEEELRKRGYENTNEIIR